MKKVLTRSLLTWFLAIAFFAGLGYFVVRLVMNANEWAQLPMNAHLSASGLAQAGAIYDRNGVVLAESVDGERVYNEKCKCARGSAPYRRRRLNEYFHGDTVGLPQRPCGL